MSTHRGGIIALDRILIALIAAAVGVWLYWFDGVPQSALRPENTVAFVGTIASLCASLLGFIIAAIIFLLGLAEAQAFKIIRASKSYKDLWTLFKGAMLSCGVTLGISVLSIFAIWLGHLPQILVWALISSLAWLILRLSSVAWVMHLIIDAEIQRGLSTRKKIERS